MENGSTTEASEGIIAGTPEWYAARDKGIGASEAATVLGLNRYQSAYRLWAEKRKLVSPPDLSDNKDVQRGNYLESVIWEQAANLGMVQGERCGRLYTSQHRPKMLFCTPDYLGHAISPNDGRAPWEGYTTATQELQDRENPVNQHGISVDMLLSDSVFPIEIKAPHIRNRKAWEALPVMYEVQVWQQMWVMQKLDGYLIAGFAGDSNQVEEIVMWHIKARLPQRFKDGNNIVSVSDSWSTYKVAHYVRRPSPHGLGRFKELSLKSMLPIDRRETYSTFIWLAQLEAFWESVLDGDRPNIQQDVARVAPEDYSNLLDEMYPKERKGSHALAGDDVYLLWKEIDSCERELKKMQSKREYLRAELKQRIGSNESISFNTIDGPAFASWKTQTRKAYDVQASSARVLRISSPENYFKELE